LNPSLQQLPTDAPTHPPRVDAMSPEQERKSVLLGSIYLGDFYGLTKKKVICWVNFILTDKSSLPFSNFKDLNSVGEALELLRKT
jgi:hypothetical protein